MTFDFLDHAMLSRLAALPVETRLPLAGDMTGRHRSPLRGTSSVFSEYRKYAPGDDIRRLDWKAYARSDRHYIKQYEAETNLRACFLVDSSGSMNFSGKGETKIQYARRIAASLAYLLVHQGDTAGLFLSREKLHPAVPPGRGPAHLPRLFSALADIAPAGNTGLPASLHAFAETTRRRSLVIVISDLFTDPAALGDALRHLRHRGHDTAVFHLMDPREISFPFTRPHHFLDLENGSSFPADPALVADGYKTALQSFLRDIRARCHEARASYRLVTTDTPLEPLLRAFLTSRLPKPQSR